MGARRVNPTRMELTRLKRKLATATRGHKLLKDKQDELMRQFLDLVQTNYRLRQQVEENIKKSSQNFALARSLMPDQLLETALLAPGQQVHVNATVVKVMSVPIPKFDYKYKTSNSSNTYPYGFAYTSSDLDDAVKNVSQIIPQMLELAQVEKTCQIMSYEIEKTRRRVNALEHVMIPETKSQIRYIKMKLDENERSAQVRLMKVKDMILEKSHNYEE